MKAINIDLQKTLGTMTLRSMTYFTDFLLQ